MAKSLMCIYRRNAMNQQRNAFSNACYEAMEMNFGRSKKLTCRYHLTCQYPLVADRTGNPGDVRKFYNATHPEQRKNNYLTEKKPFSMLAQKLHYNP
jgi:hypothetical protein